MSIAWKVLKWPLFVIVDAAIILYVVKFFVCGVIGCH